MPILKLWQNGVCREIVFSGTSKLSAILQQHGVAADHPCGGRGKCGKCAICAEGALSAPTPAEEAAGSRLSCQTVLLGDASVWLPEDTGKVETAGSMPCIGTAMEGRFGAAVDIGTTTLALKLFDLENGRLLAEGGRLNPQRSIAADVMGRIGAAMEGQASLLQNMVTDCLRDLLKQCCLQSGIRPEHVDALVVTGNTTMLYLLTGRDPRSLSCAPFAADCLFGSHDTLLGIPVYYPPCISAFVGADIACALLESDMAQPGRINLLCDIGTNGELALWKKDRLYVTSTAAGPAFEGAGISCGCTGKPGAIDRVWLEQGHVRIHTVDDLPAVGLCGSGLIDAIAVFLETGDIDETGSMEESSLSLGENVALLPADIRAVQLAKGAIAAGIRTLLETACVTEAEIDTLYIAGGFGSHLNAESAAAIGLIPPRLKDRVCVLGNAALSGAARMLLNREEISRTKALTDCAETVSLGGNSRFNRHFMEAMLFDNEQFFE